MKPVFDMTCNVFSGMLNPAQSINLYSCCSVTDANTNLNLAVVSI